ncbi:MAG: hypothetical protein AAF927_05040 [Bacteroidota bacterium]
MKNFTISLIIAIFLSLLLAVCNDDEAAHLRNRNRLLKLQAQGQDSTIQEFLVFFDAFEGNLNMIMEKENLLTLEDIDPELSPDQKEKILTDLQIINDLLDQNQILIKKLKQQVSANQGKLSQFEFLIDSLHSDLRIRKRDQYLKQSAIVELSQQQHAQNQQMDSLETLNQRLLSLSRVQAEVIAEQESSIYQKEDTIRQKDEALKRAYYIVGSEKELLSKKIIKKGGVILGLGRKYKVIPELDKSALTPVNITEFEGMWVASNKVRLASQHPIDSYHFHEINEDNMRSLQIIDSERFWSMSKYLVVVFP